MALYGCLHLDPSSSFLRGLHHPPCLLLTSHVSPTPSTAPAPDPRPARLPPFPQGGTRSRWPQRYSLSPSPSQGVALDATSQAFAAAAHEHDTESQTPASQQGTTGLHPDPAALLCTVQNVFQSGFTRCSKFGIPSSEIIHGDTCRSALAEHGKEQLLKMTEHVSDHKPNPPPWKRACTFQPPTYAS